MLRRDGYRCQFPVDDTICGKPANTVDHIVPLVEGGAHLDRTNLRAACGPCNYDAGRATRQRLRTLGTPSCDW